MCSNPACSTPLVLVIHQFSPTAHMMYNTVWSPPGPKVLLGTHQMITIGDSDDDQEKMMNDKVGLGWWFQIAAQVSPIGAQLSPNLPNCATKSSNMSQKHQIRGLLIFMSPAIW